MAAVAFVIVYSGLMSRFTYFPGDYNGAMVYDGVLHADMVGRVQV